MQNINPIEEALLPPIIWYHTSAGKIFLGILIFLLIMTLGFFALTGYYVWQIKFGIGAEKLSEQFNPQFTADPSKTNLTSKNATAEDLNKLVYSVSPTSGSDKAPVTIFAFIDFQCPSSQESYPIFKEIMEKYAPIIKIVFKNMPIESIHPDIMPAHLASACANEQGAFWKYYDLLFTNKKFEPTDLFDYADKLNLDKNKFKKCLDSKKYQKNIDQDMIDAVNLGVRGTPTYFVNQTKVEGSTTKEFWDKIILENMQKSL